MKAEKAFDHSRTPKWSIYNLLSLEEFTGMSAVHHCEPFSLYSSFALYFDKLPVGSLYIYSFQLAFRLNHSHTNKSLCRRLGERERRNIKKHLPLGPLAYWDNGEIQKLVKQMG